MGLDSSTKEDARRAHDNYEAFISSTNAAAVELAGMTLKALLLLNGGAAVAMLGFVASLASNLLGEQVSLFRVVLSLQYFSLGAAAAVFASGLSYLVLYLQAAEAEAHDRVMTAPFVQRSKRSIALGRWATFLLISAIVVSGLSLVLFLRGVWLTGGIVTHAMS